MVPTKASQIPKLLEIYCRIGVWSQKKWRHNMSKVTGWFKDRTWGERWKTPGSHPFVQNHVGKTQSHLYFNLLMLFFLSTDQLSEYWMWSVSPSQSKGEPVGYNTGSGLIHGGVLSGSLGTDWEKLSLGTQTGHSLGSPSHLCVSAPTIAPVPMPSPLLCPTSPPPFF